MTTHPSKPTKSSMIKALIEQCEFLLNWLDNAEKTTKADITDTNDPFWSAQPRRDDGEIAGSRTEARLAIKKAKHNIDIS